MKKIISLVLALMMILCVGAAFAATQTPATLNLGTASITVDLPDVPEGATANNTYKIYKVFDATVSGENSENISYTPVAGKTTVPDGFTLTNGYVTHAGSATELTADEIAAIRTYVANDTPIATVTTTAADTSFTVSNLAYGYYFIDTTVGSLVTINSTKPNANVEDKNRIPGIDKKITGGSADTIDEAGKKAIAQVGTPVEFTATITIGTGAINYTFEDLMTSGLSYNNDVKVYTDAAKTNEVATSNYTKVGAREATETVPGRTFGLEFSNDYIKTLAIGSKLYVAYSANVTNDALTVDFEKNTAWVKYGQTPSDNRTPPDEVKVYSAKLTVIKEDDADHPLMGAGFKLKNSNGKYYSFSNGVVSWVDSVEATMVTGKYSEEDGETLVEASLVFKGLPAGTYTLEEAIVPDGYNKAADYTFTINAANSSEEHVFDIVNLEQSTTVENTHGAVLPSTGGIGTTIFYILGGVLVIGAAVILIARRKAQD